MPDTDGVTLLKEWQRDGLLTMPVIMMSGHATIDTAVEATRIGAMNFLEKPIALQKLLKAVQQGLTRAQEVARAPAPAPEVAFDGRRVLVEILLDDAPRERGMADAEVPGESAQRCGARPTRTAAWPRDSSSSIPRIAGNCTTFGLAIGGPDGLDPALKAEAHEKIRLSSLTLPHAMVRVLLAEALYRAWSVLEGHPYHRE